MTRDDILKAAVDAGFIGMNAGSEVVLGIPMSTGDTLVSLLERFAQAIESQVREECAAICEAHGNERWIIRPTRITDDPWKVGVFDCVELLRGDYKLDGRGKGNWDGCRTNN